MLTTFLMAMALAAPVDTASADDASLATITPEAQPWDRTGWGFGGLPAVTFNSDEGFGFGFVGSIYRYNGHDLGFVGEGMSEAGTMWQTPLPTYGGGLRPAFDKNFVVRGDVGVSPIEDYAPAVYIDLRNLF